MPESTAVAAQLYTLRDYLKTPAEIARSLHRVREIGYRAVQLSGLGPIAPQQLAEIVQAEGLTVCATHVDYYHLRDHTEEEIANHQLWNCKYVGIGGLPEEYRNEAGFRRFAQEASALGRRLAAAGLVFLYHNHAFELERFGRQTGLAILYDESDPSAFQAEIDTYWVQHGGGDPAFWIRRLAGRIPAVHLKDMAAKGQQQVMAEVGEGNLNWPEILSACRQAGVVWYIVEQDFCQHDPFESLVISRRNLQAMGLR